jgi:hypothetical protein
MDKHLFHNSTVDELFKSNIEYHSMKISRPKLVIGSYRSTSSSSPDSLSDDDYQQQSKINYKQSDTPPAKLPFLQLGLRTII